jgi:arabinofuranan 3-O-arabinosyltransferase
VIDGYANGWLIDPEVVGADAMIHLEWKPQRTIFTALALSALGVLVCPPLIVGGRRR